MVNAPHFNQAAKEEDEATLSPLEVAAAHGKVDIIDLLAQNNATIDQNNNTALMAAAKFGQTESIEKLIKLGANVNHQNNIGYTASIMAIQCNQIKALKILIEHGADKDLKGSEGISISSLASTSNPEILDIINSETAILTLTGCTTDADDS